MMIESRYVLHLHEAEKAGRHYDFRFKMPDGVWSFASKYHPWKEKMQPRLLIQQPIHTEEWLDYQGFFPGEGENKYGRGYLKIIEKGRCKIWIEKPGKQLRIALFNGLEPTELLLVHKSKNQWYCINVTGAKKKDVPSSKPKYREVDWEQAKKLVNVAEAVTPKVDGVHVFIVGEKDKPIRVFTQPGSARKGKVYEHTWKLPNNEISKDNFTARGELFFMKGDKVLSINEINSIIHSKEPKSDVEAKILLFDTDTSSKSYQEKYSKLMQIAAKHNLFILPENSKDLIKIIEEGKHPLTREGVVLYLNQEFVKAKPYKEGDFYIVGIYRSKTNPNMAGGVLISETPNGKAFCKVGSGFNFALKVDMLKNPEKYIGKVIRVKYTERTPSGALRHPTFVGFHAEKNL